MHAAIAAGTPVVEAFGYRAKAAAIERAWRERETDFAQLQDVLRSGDVSAIVDWCSSIPFIGDDTKYQLAKAFGVQVAKPDIWLCRLAGFPDTPRRPIRERFAACQALAIRLASATGDSVACVDSLLWLACQKGILTVSFEPHHVAFTPRDLHARKSIYAQPAPNADVNPASEDSALDASGFHESLKGEEAADPAATQ